MDDEDRRSASTIAASPDGSDRGEGRVYCQPVRLQHYDRLAVKFLNEHELLTYLVQLDDTEDRWKLRSGQQFADHLRTEGLLDVGRPEQEYAELGRMLWRLQADNSISYIDFAANNDPSRRRDPSFLNFTMDDVWKFENIVVRREGRMAVAATRPSKAPNAARQFDAINGALVQGASLTVEERSAMLRYLKLTNELRSCRYFVEEERSSSVTLDRGTTTSWEQKLPSAGATRDMLAVLRQLFGDRERASFASTVAQVRRLVDEHTEAGVSLLNQVAAFERAKQGVLDSWDAQPGGTDASPRTPLDTFLDWMYGEFLHSDAAKAARIETLDTEYSLYEWQFHWVVERLALLFSQFAAIVRSVIAELEPAE
jgi:hypothetical protein